MTGARLIGFGPELSLQGLGHTLPLNQSPQQMSLQSSIKCYVVCGVLNATTITCSRYFAINCIFANVLLERNAQVCFAEGPRTHLTAGLLMCWIFSKFKGRRLQVEVDVAHCLGNQGETPIKDMPPVTQIMLLCFLQLVFCAMQSPSSEAVVTCNADVLTVVKLAWYCAAETGTGLLHASLH